MRFAENGYYIEQYVKCDNCGVLIYGEGVTGSSAHAAGHLFCSRWCVAWHEQRSAGVDEPQVELAFDE